MDPAPARYLRTVISSWWSLPAQLTLEDDQLAFHFPQIEAEASFSIDFQRMLRMSDTDRTYDLPPRLAAFPLRHADDHAGRLPGQVAARGGVILPIW